MKIKVLAVGKTDRKEIELLMQTYLKRLNHYTRTEIEIVPDIRNRSKMSEQTLIKNEAAALLKQLTPTDTVVILDERGQQYSSVEFAKYLQKFMNAGIRQLVFIIGGPYGLGEEIRQRADRELSLSKMTFSHQMVRPFLLEQLYRAFSILRNEPYHHQ